MKKSIYDIVNTIQWIDETIATLKTRDPDDSLYDDVESLLTEYRDIIMSRTAEI